jgi:hypothetical protein
MIYDWQPGKEILIHYPILTDVHLLERCKYRQRRFAIRSCRDLVKMPLTPEEFARRPYVARSRWLCRVIDLEEQQYRQIYIGTSKEYRAPQVLRFGAYDRQSGDLIRLLDREFAATVAERRLMLRIMQTWISRLDESETLGIFAPDSAVLK